jgi:excinuclease ABC subunit A
VSKQTSETITGQILEHVAKWQSGKVIRQVRFMVLAPVVRDKKGEYTKLFRNLEDKGLEQVRIDGRIYDLDEDLVLIKTNRHTIEAVVDRLTATKADIEKAGLYERIKNDIEIALDLADGLVTLCFVEDKTFSFPKRPRQMSDVLFSSRFACPMCNLSIPEVEPRIFSFNSPFGACPQCNGLGVKLKIDPTRVSVWRAQELERRYYTTTSDIIREEIEKLMIKEICSLCQGSRLKKESLTITIDRHSIAQVSSWDLEKLLDWVSRLQSILTSGRDKEIAGPIFKEITLRLSFLISVGVNYLTLNRTASTLSAGEGQRIRLASQLGSGLTGVLYILDEPTVGLHPRDTQRLIDTLKKLRDLGNTLVVVEHDPRVLKQADQILDFGPGAGKDGGKLIAQGTPTQIMKDRKSITGAYLSGRKSIPLLKKANQESVNWLTIKDCCENNLKNISLKIPQGKLICITGVSGSGKSTLMTDTLYPALKKSFYPDFKEKTGMFKTLTGTQYLNQVLLVDQSPIGHTSRSNPATYIGVFTDIRAIFAQTRDSRIKGFTPTHFSFNTVGGRCEACEGQGRLRVQMQFLPDIWVECEECRGKRFKKEVLEVGFKEKNIAQVLKLTVKEAELFFESIPVIARKLEVLGRIGLDYLELGQPSPTLSGGESQRLKLARELVKKSEGKTVYLLDEPTTGLHFADLKKLVMVLRALVDRGDTVIIIEHNLEIIRQADWIIDLGPEGGEKGGYLMTEGPIEMITKVKNSWTGRYLLEMQNAKDKIK